MKTIKIYISTALLFLSATVGAQEGSKLETTLGADLVSQYIWRGQDLGKAALQPTLGVGYKGLSLSAWGSVGITDPADTRELDLTLAYSIGGFHLGVTDYWFDTGLDPRNRYFKYEAHSTNHVFEANIGYDFNIFALQWFTNFAGNDGHNKDDKRAYSSYFELSVPFSLASVNWTATAGAVPYATDFYGTSGFEVTNVSLRASKNIRVTDSFSVPVFAQATANPSSQKAYFVFGVTLQP